MNNNFLEKKTVKKVIKYLQNFDSNISPISLDTTARTAKDAAQSLNDPRLKYDYSAKAPPYNTGITYS